MIVVAIGEVVSNSVTVAANSQTSSTITTNNLALCGIFIPATFTSTAITFLACPTSTGTFVPVTNGTSTVSYTVAAGEYLAIDPTLFQGMPYLQIKTGTSEVAARTLICMLKGKS
jgi:hypothetical protein